MNIDIIRNHGNLEREEWRFTFSDEYSKPTIRFYYFSFQTKETTRKRKWVNQNHWDKYYERNNTMERPNVPEEIVADVKEQIKLNIDKAQLV